MPDPSTTTTTTTAGPDPGAKPAEGLSTDSAAKSSISRTDAVSRAECLADSSGRSAPSASELQSPINRPAGDKATQPTEPSAADTDTETTTSGFGSETHDPATESHFWLRRGDQMLVGLLVAVGLVLMAWHWAYLSGWGLKPVEVERLPERRFDFQLDVNKATWVEWMQLEGIGDTLAHRIVEDRRQNGPFESIDDLQRVKGIGPKTVERIRPWLRAAAPAGANE